MFESFESCQSVSVRLMIVGDVVSDYNSEELDNIPVYDVADMLKLYFHELPDCLLTERLSETCCSIFTRKLLISV